MLGDLAPGTRRGLVGPFGQRDELAVVGRVALERDVSGLRGRLGFHRFGLGLVCRLIDVGTLAVAEYNEEHNKPPIQEPLALSLSKGRLAVQPGARRKSGPSTSSGRTGRIYLPPRCASAIATANASAASAPATATPGSSTLSMAWTCAFSAPPVPTTAFLTSRAACSATGSEACPHAARTAPRRCAN